MMKKSILVAVAISSSIVGACTTATPVPNEVQNPWVANTVSDLGTNLGRIYLKNSPLPATVVVAPAVKHDGQLRPSYYGETLATLISGALVNSGVPVVQTESSGWTSGHPVNTVVKRRAEAANAGVIALGSYHHLGGETVVSYRLIDTRTGAVLAVSEGRIPGGGQ
jgi:TolB-like protein